MKPEPLPIPAPLAMAAVLVVLGGLMAGLAAIQRRTPMHSELSRKLVHVGMGMVTLSFPWLFAAQWPVIVLAAGAGAGLAAVRTVPAIRAQLGGVLDGVGRASYGDILFPIAVAWVFVGANGDWLLFVVPVLVLTLADAVGALVGTRYGLSPYTTDDGHKSFEGSTAFFVVAFLAIHIPLLLGTETGRAECLMVSLTLALLVTMMEAMAWRGWDNLFVPLTCHLLLRIYPDLSLGDMAARLVALVALAVFALAWRRHTTLTDSAALGAAILAYTVWALAGWMWLVPPLLLYAVYAKMMPLRGGRVSGGDMMAVLRTMSGPLGFMVAGLSYAGPAWILLFYATFAAHLANISISRMCDEEDSLPERRRAVGRAAAAGALLFGVAYVGVVERSAMGVIHAGWLAAAALISASIFCWSLPHARTDAPGPSVWLREAALAPACAALCAIPLLYGSNG